MLGQGGTKKYAAILSKDIKSVFMNTSIMFLYAAGHVGARGVLYRYCEQWSIYLGFYFLFNLSTLATFFLIDDLDIKEGIRQIVQNNKGQG